jgi:hypothetical protein
MIHSPQHLTVIQAAGIWWNHREFLGALLVSYPRKQYLLAPKDENTPEYIVKQSQINLANIGVLLLVYLAYPFYLTTFSFQN